MFMSPRMISIALGVAAATAAAFVLAPDRFGAQAQAPLAPCTCSRSTPILGTDEVSAVPGQLQPRFGVTHCQCGGSTCVSQVAYGSIGTSQLFCVK